MKNFMSFLQVENFFLCLVFDLVKTVCPYERFENDGCCNFKSPGLVNIVLTFVHLFKVFCARPLISVMLLTCENTYI